MARVARVTIAGCSLLALAACGREAGAAAEPSAPTTTVPASTTTVVTSTTSAPTTTLSPEQRDDADLRALHDRFYRMIAVSANPPDPDHPEIAATTTGIERQRWTEFMQQMLNNREHSEGPIHGRIISIQRIDESDALIQTCTAGATVRLAADGTVVGRDDQTPIITGIRVVRTADGWRIEDWYTGGTDRCVA